MYWNTLARILTWSSEYRCSLLLTVHVGLISGTLHCCNMLPASGWTGANPFLLVGECIELFTLGSILSPLQNPESLWLFWAVVSYCVRVVSRKVSSWLKVRFIGLRGGEELTKGREREFLALFFHTGVTLWRGVLCDRREELDVVTVVLLLLGVDDEKIEVEPVVESSDLFLGLCKLNTKIL